MTPSFYLPSSPPSLLFAPNTRAAEEWAVRILPTTDTTHLDEMIELFTLHKNGDLHQSVSYRYIKKAKMALPESGSNQDWRRPPQGN
jgi:hypothetical protein